MANPQDGVAICATVACLVHCLDFREVSTYHDQDSIWVDVPEEWLSGVRQDS